MLILGMLRVTRWACSSLVPSLSAPVFTSLAVFRTASDVKTGAERLGTRLGMQNFSFCLEVWMCWLNRAAFVGLSVHTRASTAIERP